MSRFNTYQKRGEHESRAVGLRYQKAKQMTEKANGSKRAPYTRSESKEGFKRHERVDER